MWIRTVAGLRWIEVEQTKQGLWIPKSMTKISNNKDNNRDND